MLSNQAVDLEGAS